MFLIVQIKIEEYVQSLEASQIKLNYAYFVLGTVCSLTKWPC